jgi:predicted transposase YdaD
MATRLIELSADEKARAIREAALKARIDHFAQIASAREEGEAIGEARGREEGRMEERRATAWSLLQMGIALETIMVATRLSREEILALREAGPQA